MNCSLSRRAELHNEGLLDEEECERERDADTCMLLHGSACMLGKANDSETEVERQIWIGRLLGP